MDTADTNTTPNPTHETIKAAKLACIAVEYKTFNIGERTIHEVSMLGEFGRVTITKDDTNDWNDSAEAVKAIRDMYMILLNIKYP
jgi:hypothetical protein